MQQIPLLIISDSITAGTGFARISKDIATRVHAHLGDVYRVGTAGYGGAYSRSFGFPQYILEMSDWVATNLMEVWKDFAGDEKGVVMCIWDSARLGWLSRPEMSPYLVDKPVLGDFLLKAPFQKWLYAPVDASGPNDRLTFPLMQNLLGFDRILAYGQWGEGVLRRTLGDVEADKRHLTSLPHGVDTSIFYERDRTQSRKFFPQITQAHTLRGQLVTRIEKDDVAIGINATNQSRKDFALGIEACAILAKTRKVKMWLHTDTLERHWSIPSLLVDFGLVDNACISTNVLSDDALAQAYSAMDVTLGIGAEGYGFSHVESLACGTPCVTGSYAGGAEIANPDMLVDPIAFRYESIWACKRPVYDPRDWATKTNEWIGIRSTSDPKYDWNGGILWPAWRKYLLEAAK